MRKIVSCFSYLAIVVMALSLALLLPTGTISEDAISQYQSDMFSSESTADLIMKYHPTAIMASAVLSDILPAANIAPLSIDFAPGKTPIAENFSDYGYRDNSIIVELEKRRMYESDIYIAFVKIATPSQLRTAVAGDKVTSTRTNQTSRIGANYNAIVAVNGDYFTNTQGGYIVRQGEEVRKLVSNNLDLLLIDELGDFHILIHGKENQENAIAALESEHEVVNGFFFGPGLVKDGEVLDIPEEYQWAPDSANPRAAIGQLDTLTYAMVAVNGRTNDSVGVTMAELADIMAEIGCMQAYNLDGGNSATLAFNGEVFNDKPQAERDVTDIIYFATAVDGE